MSMSGLLMDRGMLQNTVVRHQKAAWGCNFFYRVLVTSRAPVALEQCPKEKQKSVIHSSEIHNLCQCSEPLLTERFLLVWMFISQHLSLQAHLEFLELERKCQIFAIVRTKMMRK